MRWMKLLWMLIPAMNVRPILYCGKLCRSYWIISSLAVQHLQRIAIGVVNFSQHTRAESSAALTSSFWILERTLH